MPPIRGRGGAALVSPMPLPPCHESLSGPQSTIADLSERCLSTGSASSGTAFPRVLGP